MGKLIAFVLGLASAMMMHPRFPDSTNPNDRFWLTSAAMALTAEQEGGKLDGYGITQVDRIVCKRMHTVENAGSPCEEHIQHCNMTWLSNSWGHVNQCITSLDIRACVRCRRMPVSEN